MYGVDCLSLSDKCINSLQSTQGCVMKQVCGLGKRSRHSAILQALNIAPASMLINDSTKSLFTRICTTDSPTRDTCVHFLNLFITNHVLIPGTLIDRLIKMGISPSSLLQSRQKESI